MCKLRGPKISAMTYITTAMPYWQAAGGPAFCLVLQEQLQITGGSSRTKAKPHLCLSLQSKKGVVRMGVRVCVWVNVCNRGREVKGERLHQEGKACKMKRKSYFTSLTTHADPVFLLGWRRHIFTSFTYLFSCILRAPALPISVLLSQQPQFFVCQAFLLDEGMLR